jgi:hypothetical protein
MFRSHSLRFSLQDLFSVDSASSALKSPFNPSTQIRQTTCSSFIALLQKTPKLNSSFSIPCALFKKEYFSNSFAAVGFRTLLQNTRGVPSPATRRLPMFSTAAPADPHSTACNSFTVMDLLYGSLDTRGVGATVRGYRPGTSLTEQTGGIPDTARSMAIACKRSACHGKRAVLWKKNLDLSSSTSYGNAA